MKTYYFLILFFFLAPFKNFSQNIPTCGIENLVGWGTAGGAWLRQSFQPQEDIQDPTISMPCFLVNPAMMKMSLYQGSVWDANPTLLATTEIFVDAEIAPLFPEGEPPIWYSITVPNQILEAGQEYFIQIEDTDPNVANTIFGYGTAGTEDYFIYGEERDPLTPFAGVGYWFPDLMISVQGNCSTCQGDFNYDGIVGIADLIMLIAVNGCLSNCESFDMNADSVIGVGDLTEFLALFGTSCSE